MIGRFPCFHKILCLHIYNGAFSPPPNESPRSKAIPSQHGGAQGAPRPKCAPVHSQEHESTCHGRAPDSGFPRNRLLSTRGLCQMESGTDRFNHCLCCVMGPKWSPTMKGRRGTLPKNQFQGPPLNAGGGEDHVRAAQVRSAVGATPAWERHTQSRSPRPGNGRLPPRETFWEKGPERETCSPHHCSSSCFLFLLKTQAALL